MGGPPWGRYGVKSRTGAGAPAGGAAGAGPGGAAAPAGGGRASPRPGGRASGPAVGSPPAACVAPLAGLGLSTRPPWAAVVGRHYASGAHGCQGGEPRVIAS